MTDSITVSATPLRDAFLAAVALRDAAESAMESYGGEDEATHDALYASYSDAVDAAEEAQRAFRGSDEPEIWRIRYRDGSGYEAQLNETPCSLGEALALAQADVESCDWDLESAGSVWVDVEIVGESGADALLTVQMDQQEPECRDDEHDWQSPHAIVGGIKENPGVWGNGGGVIINEVCVHCGCGRRTNTWATRPDNGTQGHTVVSYEPGKYSEEIAEDAETARADYDV